MIEEVVDRQGPLVILGISVVVVLLGLIAEIYVFKFGLGGSKPITGSTSTTQNLPAGCQKPAGGYLIIASVSGFNDSISHGAPTKAWPIVTVNKGDTVKLVVCNIDSQAHGFQINNYFDSNIESVAPGQAITVSFVADKTGTFTIYCSIPCSVHIRMQSGELRVVGS